MDDFKPKTTAALSAFVQRHHIGTAVDVAGDTLVLHADGQYIPLGDWGSGNWWPTVKQLAPISWYVDEMVFRGRWRQETIPAHVAGLTRDLTVLRARRKEALIVHKWHGDADTFCPPIWSDLAIGSGACGQCRACFLILTHRARRDPRRHLLYDNTAEFWRAAAVWLRAEGKYAYTRQASTQRTLGLGIDRSDSLLFEEIAGHARALIPLFADPESNPDRRRLVLVTKTANTHYLEGLPTANVIVSGSLNPEAVALVWENEWPDGERVTRPIADRVAALSAAQRMGFEVRIRLDPILPIPGWQEAYREFAADAAAGGLRPSRISLGTYRQKNDQLFPEM